jgi:maltose alpha-D-glucosyltransferase/alpha-amylase
MLLHGDGIRRRLAPLLDHDRRRIQLAFALLLSLPGTPIVYYGDEIGMGDNVALADRDGVRTPMQWTDGANGGFSEAPAERLVLPPIERGAGSYRRANVEQQLEDSDSLLAGIKRLIARRTATPAFGRGAVEFLEVGNPSVLAFVRRHESSAVCVAANLTKSPQPAVVPWPAASSVQTLAPYACEWFDLTAAATASVLPAGIAR